MYTLDHKIAELKREIRMRKRVYPRQVKRQKMSQEEADRRIEVMRSILSDYKKEKRKQAPRLFD